jgi:hypothetical protein
MKQYDHIQNKLKQYSVNVDKEKLWANTSHAIPRKRNRRGFILFFSGMALLVAGSMFFLLPSTRAALAKTKVAASAQTTTHSSSNKTADFEETNASVSNDAHTSVSNTPTTSPSNTTQSIQQAHNTQNFSTSDIHQNTTDPNATKKAARQKQKNTGKLLIPSSKQRTESPDAAAATNEVNSEFTPWTSTAEIVSSDETNTSSSDEFKMAKRTLNWKSEPIDDLLIKSLEEIERPIGIESMSPGIQPKGNNFPIGIFLIQGIGFSTLRIEPQSADVEDIASTLSTNTTSLEQLYTSLHATTPVNRNLQVSAGLQYSRLTTELIQTTLTTEDYLTEGITSIIIGEDGQVENLYGNVNVHREVYTSSTRYTFQHKLDLEVMLQANVFQGPRWASGLWIKGSYNLLYTSEGTTLDTEGQLLPYTSSANPFHLKTPFGYGAGLNTTYKITPSWAILGRIGYERMVYTHGVFDDQLIYKHNIFNLGLGTSLSF